MPTPKPPYPAGFREQMVKLAQAGRSLKQLSREFDVSVNSVRKWVQQARGATPKAGVGGERPAAGTAALQQELVELRRKLRQVQQERDILAKATAWFAGKSERTSTTSTNS